MPASGREFINLGIADVVNAAVASSVEIPVIESSIQNSNNQISQLQSEKNSIQNQINQAQGFLTLARAFSNLARLNLFF